LQAVDLEVFKLDARKDLDQLVESVPKSGIRWSIGKGTAPTK